MKKPKKSIILKNSRELTEMQVKHKYINIYEYLFIYKYTYIYNIYIYIQLTQIIQVIVYFILSAAPSNISAPILRATPHHVWHFPFRLSKHVVITT